MEVAIGQQFVRVLPGESVHTVVNVRNNSKIVDVLSIEVQGLDPSWCELSIGGASLFPGDNFDSTLSFMPPKESSAAAKAYPFDVVVKSRQNPAPAVSARGTLNVGPFYSFSAELYQHSITTSLASYALAIHNNSNVPITFMLEIQELDEDLRLSLESESMTVAPGASGEVGLTVEPLRRPLSGDPRPRDFALSVSTDAGTGRPVIVTAQTEMHPWIPAPGWAISLVLVGIAAIAVAVWRLLK